MAIPSTVPQTAAGYIDYLASQINLADKMWTHYAWAVSGAYAKAYGLNSGALREAKVVIERQKQSDYDRMSFALSLLTVGVAGATAGAVARSMYESKKLEDAAKDIIKRALQQPAGAVIDVLSPDKKTPDVFAPSDTTPEEYTTNLFEGITYNVALLTKILNEVRWNPNPTSVRYNNKVIDLKSGGQMSADEAKKLTEEIIDSSFMTEMPSLDVTREALTPKAQLALWIGWASARDVNYWAHADKTNTNEYYGKGPMRNDDLNEMTDAFWEQYKWEPVRKQLMLLGVPKDTITAKIVMQGVGWGRSGWKENPGLYMWGFIQWSGSPAAVNLLFDRSLPKSAKGFEMVQKKMQRIMTPIGWIDMNP